MGVCPLIFEPIYKPKIWGGGRICAHFGRPPGSREPIGESWELADLEDDESRVAVEPARGRTLTQLVAEWGSDLIGHVRLFAGRFPLLIKFLDAREPLSIQVHPGEKMVGTLGGGVQPKHEAWYVLAAEPGSVIYHGLAAGVTAATFRSAMSTGQIEGVLRKIAVKPGDCYYLPSGIPHALGAGVLVAEVQTPCDVTYRAYDWGRIDPATGRPRELHLDQAVECIDFDAASPPPMQPRSHVAGFWTAVTRLAACPYFVIERVRMAEGAEQLIPYAEPVVWIVLEGRGLIERPDGEALLAFGRGNVVLLPAALGEAKVRTTAPTQWLEVTVPVRSDPAGGECRLPAPPTSPAPPAPSPADGGPVQINLPPRR